jgi:Arm DNA-binding domain
MRPATNKSNKPAVEATEPAPDSAASEYQKQRRQRVSETKRLSTSIVEGLVPIRGNDLAWDTRVPGFGVRLNKTGRRTYFLKYRTASGAIRKPKIGDHGAITCDEARKIAQEWYLDARRGNDPSGDRKAKRTGETIADL